MKVILTGGTRRAIKTLKQIIKKSDVDIKLFLVQRDYPWDEQCHIELENILKKEKIPFETYEPTEKLSIKTIKKINKIKPDAIIGTGIWRSLLPKEMWQNSRYGYIGLHGSNLPEYRGFANLNWYIINGEREYIMSMIQLDEGVDTGNLVYRKNKKPFTTSISLENNKNINEILKEVERKHIQLTLELIEHIKKDEIIFVKQNESKATWACQRGPDDGEINWRKSTKKIFNFIRAQSKPYPGAFSYYRNKKFYIWKAEIPKRTKKYVGRIPGKVIERNKKYCDVLTNDGIIRILEITVDTKKIQTNLFLTSVREILGFNPRSEMEQMREKIIELEKKVDKITKQKAENFKKIQGDLD